MLYLCILFCQVYLSSILVCFYEYCRTKVFTNFCRHDKSNTLNKRDWRKSTPDLGLNVKDPELLDNQSPKETHQKSYTPIVSINNVSY